MTLLTRLRRFLNATPLDDLPVRLHALAPTTDPAEAAKLAARPVTRPSGQVVFLFGSSANKAPSNFPTIATHEAVGADLIAVSDSAGAKRLIEDQDDYRPIG